MATLVLTNTFTDATTAVAADVNTNFTDVKTFVEALAAGTNIDALAITYAQLKAATITSLSAAAVLAAADSDQVVLGGQVFG